MIKINRSRKPSEKRNQAEKKARELEEIFWGAGNNASQTKKQNTMMVERE